MVFYVVKFENLNALAGPLWRYLAQASREEAQDVAFDLCQHGFRGVSVIVVCMPCRHHCVGVCRDILNAPMVPI